MTENPENGIRWRDSRGRKAVWAAAAFLFLLPLLAIQFTDQVVWDILDFSILGAMLVSVGATIELAARKKNNPTNFFALGVAFAAAFILIFVNLAVGIIGTENNEANLMFGGVLAVGIIGAIIARFQPRGMAHALIATAIAQAVVAGIALTAGLGSPGPIWPWDILASTGFFAALWLTSAWLFRKTGSR